MLGLEFGADDYMTKPFDMRELVARVKALARRGAYAAPEAEASEGAVATLGGVTADPVSRTAKAGDEQLELTPKEFDLLLLLLRNPERVYTREDLLAQVWDIDFAGGTRTIDIHVQRLRRKLKQRQGLIQTVYGIGYKAAETP